MRKIKINSNILPIIILSIMMIAAFCFSIHFVYASGGSLAQCDTNWDNYENKMNASADDTYPYDSDSATITSVSLDVLYGTTRGLVVYHGEVPYAQIYDDEDEYEDGWEGYYAEDGTDAGANTNPTFGASSGADADDYWGSGVNADSFENVPTAEQVNATSTVSLRLLALANTKTGFTYWLNTAGYAVVKFFAWLAVFIIGLIVRAKNLSMDLIMDILHLDDLNDMLTKNFIWDGDHLKLSAFTAFCILALIFTLVAFVIRWVKGADKTRGIWEILGTIGLGLLIIGMCLTGRISSLGSSVATMANNVMYSVAESLSSSGDGKAFEIKISDAGNETEITQMCEMSLVNKAFIDLQLCCQFNVNSVDQLKFSALGDPGGSNASSYLAGVNGANMHDDFNENLGYYFWFANSSASSKTSKNATYPSTDTLSVTNKLNSMVTYLQHQYNVSNNATKANIADILLALSNANGSLRFLCLLVFAIALVLMAFVLLKYAINVIIAKMELFIALLGMVLAGPLILTSNKKLVETGKAILGMLVVSFLEVTIYSIIFDIIIYAVSTMFAPAIPNLLAVIAILLLLLKFNPVLAQKIKQIMERTTRAISPTLVDGRRAVKQWAKNKANDKIRDYDNSKRIAGYDADGNAIYEQRKGDALSKLMHHGSNALLAEGNEVKSGHKINKELSDARNASKNATADAKRMAAQNDVNEKLETINNEAKRSEEEINAEVKKTTNAAYDRVYDDNGNLISESFNKDAMSEEEKRMAHTYEKHNDELEEIIKSKDYQDLVKERHALDEANKKLEAEGKETVAFDATKDNQLKAYQAKISAKRAQIKSEKNKIDAAIKERAATNAMRKRGMDIDSAKGDTIDEKIANASKAKALQEHRNELEKTLNAAINTMSAEVNDTSKKSKIGSNETSRVNRDAARDQAAAMLQLSQLQNGEDVMDTNAAKKEVQEIVDKVAMAEEYTAPVSGTAHKVKDGVHNIQHIGREETAEGKALNAAKAAYKQSKPGSPRHAELKQQYEDALKTYKDKYGEEKAEALSQYEDTRKEVGGGRFIGRTSVQDQLQSAVNNRAKGNANSGNTTSRNTPNPYGAAQDNMQSVVNTQAARRGGANVIDSIDVPPAPTTQQRTPTRSTQPTRQQQTARHYSQPEPARSPRGNTAPDMSSIINQQQSQQPQPRAHETHKADDTKTNYAQDEARRLQEAADNDFWSRERKNETGNKF